MRKRRKTDQKVRLESEQRLQIPKNGGRLGVEQWWTGRQIVAGGNAFVAIGLVATTSVLP